MRAHAVAANPSNIRQRKELGLEEKVGKNKRARRAVQPQTVEGEFAAEASARESKAETTQTWSTAAARQQRIAEAAYYRAQRRGFAAGSEMEDWLAAESEIDQHSH